MTDTGARLPEWVIDGAGRRVPFEPDRICQALFAAGEDLGRSDAFLARELADAVVHFLTNEGDEPLTPERIAERVASVVRELGQPELARAYARRRERRRRDVADAPLIEGRFTFALDAAPAAVARDFGRAFALQAVHSRDLAAARDEGLIVLGGLDAPAALASYAPETPFPLDDSPDALVALQDAARSTGAALILDGPEWMPGEDAWERRCRWLWAAPRLARCPIVVNVHAAEPPAWAQVCGAGPLFPDGTAAAETPRRAARLQLLLEGAPPAPDWRLALHLHGDDFSDGPGRDLLRRAVRRTLDGQPTVFVFDRPRRPIALAEGVDRRFPGTLLEVGLCLPALLRRPEIAGDGRSLLKRLPSLARMAVSAGVQKRRFLRRHVEGTPLARGFVLERARLLVAPLGLEEITRTLTGQGPADSPLALDLAVQLIAALAGGIAEAGRAAQLDVALDQPGPSLQRELCDAETGEPLASARKQLHAADRLQAAAGGGSVIVRLDPNKPVTPDDLIELLHHAWKRTTLTRVSFRRVAAEVRQPDLEGMSEDA